MISLKSILPLGLRFIFLRRPSKWQGVQLLAPWFLFASLTLLRLITDQLRIVSQFWESLTSVFGSLYDQIWEALIVRLPHLGVLLSTEEFVRFLQFSFRSWKSIRLLIIYEVHA